MTIADKARESAIHCEMKKYALRQSKDGIVVSFVVHPHEVPAALSTSQIGTRYMVALVEIGDDEQPKEVMPHSAKSRLNKAKPGQAEGSDRAKKDWRDLPPAQQAALRCNDAIFRAFLKTKGYAPTDADDAAEAVRDVFGIASRAELNEMANVWRKFDDQFVAWKMLEHA